MGAAVSVLLALNARIDFLSISLFSFGYRKLERASEKPRPRIFVKAYKFAYFRNKYAYASSYF